MALAPATLPDDPADLQQYCRQLLAELGEKQQLIDKLSHQLALFRRYVYGLMLRAARSRAAPA